MRVRLITCFLPILLLATMLLPGDAGASGDPWREFGVIRLKDRPPLKDFTLKDVEGRDVSLSEFSGKVVILNFWATWCVPCVKEMPSFDSLYKALANDGLVVLGVDYLEDQKKVKVFLKEVPVTFPVLLDKEGDVVKSYNVMGLPFTYIIDKNGRIAGKSIGIREWDSNLGVALVRALLME